jgi:hypothetical protein
MNVKAINHVARAVGAARAVGGSLRVVDHEAY